jgi:undecaprenyl-diphosphatase
MNVIEAIVLGLVQGLSEFLPISSSGHLVLVESMLGITIDTLSFQVAVHFASLLAVIIYFWKDIVKITSRELRLILVASIPVGLVGFLFKNQIETFFNSVILVSILLLITGVLNILTDKKLKTAIVESDEGKNDVSIEFSYKQVFVIGLFQMLALLPGLSRSGFTVAGGVFQNVDRRKAFKFSFLMLIPVILGASLLQVLEIVKFGLNGISLPSLLFGSVAAFISGYFSLKIFEYVITSAKLKIFGIYCLILGLSSIVVQYLV